MVTRRKTVQAGDESGIVLMPVNGQGEIVRGAGAWQMPAGEHVDEPPFDDEPQIEAEPEETSADRVLALLQGAGSDAAAKLELYRLPGGGRKLTWIDTMTPEDFERGGLKFISEKWGGGEYELRLYGTFANGKTGLRTRVQISIEAPRAMPGLPVAAVQDTAMAQVLARMSEQQAEMLRALTERPAPVDPMQQMTQMLTMMKLMKEASGTPEAPKSAIGDIVAAIKELKGVSSIINPETESDSPMAMVKQMMPLIQAGMAQRAANPQPQPQPQAQRVFPPVGLNPTPEHQENPIQPVGETDVNTNPELAELQKNMAALLALAALDMPPESGAVIVYQKLPDEMIAVLEQENWWEMLSGMEARVIPYQAWFTAVRDEALAMFDEPDEAEQNDTPKPAPLQVVQEVPKDAAAEPAPKPAAKRRATPVAPAAAD